MDNNSNFGCEAERLILSGYRDALRRWWTLPRRISGWNLLPGPHAIRSRAICIGKTGLRKGTGRCWISRSKRHIAGVCTRMASCPCCQARKSLRSMYANGTFKFDVIYSSDILLRHTRIYGNRIYEDIRGLSL